MEIYECLRNAHGVTMVGFFVKLKILTRLVFGRIKRHTTHCFAEVVTDNGNIGFYHSELYCSRKPPNDRRVAELSKYWLSLFIVRILSSHQIRIFTQSMWSRLKKKENIALALNATTKNQLPGCRGTKFMVALRIDNNWFMDSWMKVSNRSHHGLVELIWFTPIICNIYIELLIVFTLKITTFISGYIDNEQSNEYNGWRECIVNVSVSSKTERLNLSK